MLDADARAILGPDARFLASGATCAVYTDGRRALRLASDPQARLTMQATLQRKLRAAHQPVPQVLEVGLSPSGRAFCLETLVAGDDGGPSAAGWADLERTLGALHALPHAGFGVLQDRADTSVGLASTPTRGLRTRLDPGRSALWSF